MNVPGAAAGLVRSCKATPQRYEDIWKRCARTIPNWREPTAMRPKARWRFSKGTIPLSRFWTANGLLIMVLLGALLEPSQAQTDERRDACRVNINQAAAEELEKVPGIGPARAAMIVRMRRKNGPFRQVEELRALPRLTEKTLEAVQKLVTVSQCEPGPGAATKPAARRIKSDE